MNEETITEFVTRCRRLADNGSFVKTPLGFRLKHEDAILVVTRTFNTVNKVCPIRLVVQARLESSNSMYTVCSWDEHTTPALFIGDDDLRRLVIHLRTKMVLDDMSRIVT